MNRLAAYLISRTRFGWWGVVLPAVWRRRHQIAQLLERAGVRGFRHTRPYRSSENMAPKPPPRRVA